jgi:hypothetical protein
MFSLYSKTQKANDILPTPEKCDREIRLHFLHKNGTIFNDRARADYEKFTKGMYANIGSKNPIR